MIDKSRCLSVSANFVFLFEENRSHRDLHEPTHSCPPRRSAEHAPDDILAALRSALEDAERGLGDRGLSIGDEQLRLIATAADGDVRRGLTLLEIAAELAGEEVEDRKSTRLNSSH